MGQNRIIYLHERYLNQKLSRDELREWKGILVDRQQEALLKALMKETWEELKTTTLEDMPEQRAENLFQDITALPQLKQRKLGLRNLLGAPVRIAVAASIALAIIMGGYFYYQSRDTEAPRTVKVLKDLAPGSKRATLTLAGGRTIVLDSANAGELALVDGTRISKTTGGQLMYENNAEGKAQINTIEIPRGGEYELFLPDGTHVWLNAATRISYPTRFTGNKRRVKITGEAYLEVAKDAAHPFIVETQGQEIKVLGTHFNLNTYDSGRIVTTLAEGSVRVSSLEGTRQSRTIKPGQQSVLSAGELAVSPADLESALAWKNGLMLFKRAPLKNVLEEVARWYDLDVEYKGVPEDKTLSGGVSRSWNLSAVLRILKLTGVQATLISEGNTRKLVVENGKGN